MNTYLLTKFSECFFLLETVLGLKEERKNVFIRLADIFGVPDAEKLYGEYSDKEIMEVDSVKKYNQHERLKIFHKANETYTASMQEKDKYVYVKGQALVKAQNLKLIAPDLITDTEIITNLAEMAGEGQIDAMWIYGFALTEGIAMPKNEYSGMQVLKKATRWNSPEACILCIYYDAADAGKYLNVLSAVLKHTPYQFVADAMAERLGLPVVPDESALLLEKAIRRGLAKREAYDGIIARIIGCSGLSHADKREAVLTSGREYLEAVSKLPLNIPAWGAVAFTAEGLPGREREMDAIARIVKNARLCNMEQFKPLCIVCPEAYLTGFYASAIKGALTQCNVIEVDVGKVDASVFEYNAHNLIVDGIDEKRKNAVIFRLNGNVSAARLDIVKCFLNSIQRAAFRCYGLTVNLSDVYPIVLCDKVNAVYVKDECTVLEAAPVSQEEKIWAINRAITENKRAFGIESLKVEDDALEKLYSYGVDSALAAIDKIFLSLQQGEDNVITVALLKQCVNGNNTIFGFGGV